MAQRVERSLRHGARLLARRADPERGVAVPVAADPWVMNNPGAPANMKKIDKCDLMLITHGHFDHIHDAVEIAKATKPKIICVAETGGWLQKQGVEADTIIAGNKGGTLDVDGIKV